MSGDFGLKLEKFEGPLELLLHLVEKNKLDIYDIPIAEILRQYMDYLERIKKIDLNLATEFTVMAAVLIYIKSKTLLPKAEPEEADPRMQLAEALAEYKRIKEAIPFFAGRLPDGQNRFTRAPAPRAEVRPEDYKQSVMDIIRAYANISQKEERKRPATRESFSEILAKEVISVEDKSKEIVTSLQKLKSLEVGALLKMEKDKRHAVAAFLALLELLRNGIALIEEGEGLPVIKLLENRVVSEKV